MIVDVPAVRTLFRIATDLVRHAKYQTVFCVPGTTPKSVTSARLATFWISSPKAFVYYRNLQSFPVFRIQRYANVRHFNSTSMESVRHVKQRIVVCVLQLIPMIVMYVYQIMCTILQVKIVTHLYVTFKIKYG